MSVEPKPAPETGVLATLEQRLTAERLEFEAARDAYTEDLIRREARIRRTEADIRDAKRRLRAGETLGTLLAMPHADPIARPNGWGRPLDDADPLRRVGNLAGWARTNGVSYATVKRWKTKERSGNPIPLEWATHFRKKYGVPYTYWPHGVTRPKE